MGHLICISIKEPQKNDSGYAFNGLNLMYRKQKFFTLDKCCRSLNTINNGEVIQMLHESFFDLKSFLDDLYYRPDPKLSTSIMTSR